jgi:hypothetical protein
MVQGRQRRWPNADSQASGGGEEGQRAWIRMEGGSPVAKPDR